MRIASLAPALAAAVGLSGCAAPPPKGPTVLALPGANKTLAQFQLDDAGCRNYARVRIGETSPSPGAQTGAPGAAAGTAVSAAAGTTQPTYAGASAQRMYDISYIQCMVSNGDKLQSYATYADAGPGPYASLPYPYAYPYSGYGYGYGYPGFFGGPVITFGFGGGWGGRHGGWGEGGRRRWH